MKKLLLIIVTFLLGSMNQLSFAADKQAKKKLKEAKILQSGLKAIGNSLVALGNEDTKKFAESNKKEIACKVLKGIFGKLRVQIDDPENPGEKITELKTLLEIIREDYFEPGEMTSDQELKLDLVGANIPIALKAFGCK